MSQQRKAYLSDAVWANVRERAALEEMSATSLCAYVLEHYLGLPEEQRSTEITQVPLPARPRTLYLDKAVWVASVRCSVREGRSVSAILEQQLRKYLGMPTTSQPDS